MFGRDAVTNLSQLTKPKLRYMGTEVLILDLELMSNIFQTQIHNLRMALIGTVYRNSSSSTNNNYCLSRSSPEDPVNLKFRSAHVLHGPMRA